MNQVGAWAYTSDTVGNLTGVNGAVVTYGVNNRMIRVAASNGAVAGDYLYNGLGRRASKEVGGKFTVFAYDLSGNLILEYDWTTQAITEHVYGPGGRLATVAPDGSIYWHHNDHLGTPQAMTDSTGKVVWTMSQTPFGIATVNEDPDGDGIKVTNNFRFPGQYFDAETGANYNYFRTYVPAFGRYTQHDPIGLDGGMNPFGYVGGNPISEIDPFGLKLIRVPWLNVKYNFLDDSIEPLVRKFKDDAKACGIKVIFTEAFRPSGYQSALAKNPNAITPANAGSSLHEAGFAIDLSWRRVQRDKRDLLVKIARKAGLRWGGRFSRPDPVHFYKEVPGGRSNRGVYIRAAQEEYTNGIR